MINDKLTIKEIIETSNMSLGNLIDVPMNVTVEIGRNQMLIKDILALKVNSIIPLDSTPEQPLKIYINNKLFALGELVIYNEKFNIRVIKILTKKDLIKE